MSNTRDLTVGIAEHLTAAGIGLSWNEEGLYPVGQTGIFTKKMPQSPDRVVTLSVVWGNDDISMPRSAPMVQIRGRGRPNDPLDVDDLLDSIETVLNGATGLTFGGLTVIQINRRIVAPLGEDENDRWERVDQYYADVDVPPTINRPEAGSW